MAFLQPVTGPPHIRFYIGVPIMYDGLLLGKPHLTTNSAATLRHCRLLGSNECTPTTIAAARADTSEKPSLSTRDGRQQESPRKGQQGEEEGGGGAARACSPPPQRAGFAESWRVHTTLAAQEAGELAGIQNLVMPSTQPVTTEERAPPPTAREASAAATAAAAAVSEEAAGVADEREGATTAAATHAPDRDTLLKKLHTFADDATDAMCADIDSWVMSEFWGSLAAVATAAEGGDAKCQFAMALSSSICHEETLDWIRRALDQGCLDARLYSGLAIFLGIDGESDAGFEVEKKAAIMRDLKMPAASDSAAAQHAVGMLLYIFDCDSGSKADFLDAARWIRKAARQGLDVVGLYNVNPVYP
jgi:hypothetical protein